METNIAVFGNRRNQLIAFGGIGGLFFGCTSFMAESAEYLARNQLALHAIIPIICFAISNCILVAVWMNLARMRPLLAIFATTILVALFVVSFWNLIAVKDSHDNLKTLPWPAPTTLTTFVALFVPLIIFFRTLTSYLRAEKSRRPQTGAT